MSPAARWAVAVPGFPALGRARVMGVVNVTPDSFSDGGVYLDAAAAIRHGLSLLAQGADLLDVGGESTRPGATRVPAQIEQARVLPVVSALVEQGAAVSVDTMRASLAARALDLGAVMINDVSGGLADPAMAPLLAERGVAYLVMHARGPSADMIGPARYDDVVLEVRAELEQRLAAVVKAGVAPSQVLLDPGFGFHKVGAQNWSLLAHLDDFVSLGQPLVVGASRKSFLGSLLPGRDGSPRPVHARDAATHATTALSAAAGAWAVRVHDVAASADAVRVVAAWAAAR
ncbi:MAG TPA: dihydropteroate synthase [Mycobacteriales bacterium]|jgi:dihydropteroate synthase|nr:dihydropteroate synthase [Mycobacteriales bacterium]